MNKAYLLLGSNMGNPGLQILQARKDIAKKIGNIVRTSDLYQTAAWGNTHQPDFLNQIIIVETALTAFQTLKTILTIEKELGRIRVKKNDPRIIDIDILFFNKEIINDPELTVPHPEIQNRRFVLVPLNQLSPNMLHPKLKKSIHQLLLYCKDELNVKKF